MSHLVRLVALCGISLTITAGLSAQVLEQHDHEHEAGAVCGSLQYDEQRQLEMVENTAKANPALYQQMLRDAKSIDNRRAMLSSDDDIVMPFYVSNQSTGQIDQINAKLMFRGHFGRVWVDVADTARTIVKNAVKSLGYGLDTATGASSRNPNKGIIENDQEVFGMPPVNQFSPDLPTQDFLLVDIKDGNTGQGFVAGFFSPYDQTDRPGSNNMNLLYIDTKEGLASGRSINALLNTVAHEYQHLIHHRTNRNSQPLFNEGCSEVASILLGYQDRKNTDYMRGTNIPLFKWNYGDEAKLLIDYQRAMTFLHYLCEQYGEGFLTQFAKTQTESMTRVTDALRAIGADPNWQGMLGNYAVANYIGKDFGDSRFIYRNRLSSTTPKAGFTYVGTSNIPATGSLLLESYGTTYAVYTNSGGLRVKFNAGTGSGYSVSAILYKGEGIPVPVEVRQLQVGQEYTFLYNNNSEVYDKIVFSIVNLGNSSQTASWSITQQAAGVDDAVAGTSGAGVQSIAPNPASGSTRVTFASPASGDVTMQLFDTRGELVRTVVENARYEAGEHDVMVNTNDLPNGIYMVRLTQDARVTSRVMVVMNK